MTDIPPVSIDLSKERTVQYNNKIRFARITAVGFSAALLVGLLAEVITNGWAGVLRPESLIVVVLEVFLAGFIFFVATPGPLRLEVSQTDVILVFARGRGIRYARSRRNLRVTLLEREWPAQSLTRQGIPDANYFLALTIREVPLSAQAFSVLRTTLDKWGLRVTTRTRPLAGSGLERVYSYRKDVT